MLEEAAGPGRRLHPAPLEYPFGRGMNLQIKVEDVDALYAAAQTAKLDMILPLEVRWYRHDDEEVGNRQFAVADPDGYYRSFSWIWEGGGCVEASRPVIRRDTSAYASP
jgi:hypothetical protein